MPADDLASCDEEVAAAERAVAELLERIAAANDRLVAAERDEAVGRSVAHDLGTALLASQERMAAERARDERVSASRAAATRLAVARLLADAGAEADELLRAADLEGAAPLPAVAR